jgi:hypothetical protein
MKKTTRRRKKADPATPARLPPPTEFLPSGETDEIFALDKPITGADLQRYRELTGAKVAAVSPILGVPRQGAWYELTDPERRGEDPVPDVAMAVLVRLYTLFPQTRPSPDMEFMPFLKRLGVDAGELAQLLGRDIYTGRIWERGKPPQTTVRLVVEALARAGVTTRNHPIFKALEALSAYEHQARGKPLTIKKPKRRGYRSPRVVSQADRDLLTRVED